MAAQRKVLTVLVVDCHLSKKWRVSLGEDVFRSFATSGNLVEGSIFSPMLFGKFFDPADEFPLWEFEQESLLSGLAASTRGKVAWDETNDHYVLRAELPPGDNKYNVEICIERGKVMEVSKQWKESSKKDWRRGHWWEYGHVRRLELPCNANGAKTEAYLDNDTFLEIRIPKYV